MDNTQKKHFRWWMVFGMGIVILGSLGMLFLRNALYTESDVSVVCNQAICFDVEVVDTPKDRQQGLMFREHLPELSGMLFVFEQSDIYNFWMKNTLIPLDMIRMDKDLRVVRVLTAEPCREDPCKIYAPEVKAVYTLEINAGLAAKYNITEGMTMRFINVY